MERKCELYTSYTHDEMTFKTNIGCFWFSALSCQNRNQSSTHADSHTQRFDTATFLTAVGVHLFDTMASVAGAGAGATARPRTRRGGGGGSSVSEVDVVVVGAGFSGLSAAVYLEKLGLKVAVLEV